MEIISRADAKEKGLSRYFTGIPCKQGHVSERRTVNASCAECCLIADRVRNAKLVQARLDKIEKDLQERKKKFPNIILRDEALEQGLDRYFTGEACNRGHISERYVISNICVQCSKDDAIKYREKYPERYKASREAFVNANPDYHKKYKKQYYIDNRERELEKCKEYRLANPEKLKAKGRKYRKNNRDKVNAYFRKKCREDVNYRITKNLRKRVSDAISRDMAVKSDKTINLLGCEVEDLKGHLEKQFKEGMTWDNYGEWHIDHIRPCASFNLVKTAQQKQCFYYTNLQPLWASENISKGCRYEGPV